jgi:hypothetical protein
MISMLSQQNLIHNWPKSHTTRVCVVPVICNHRIHFFHIEIFHRLLVVEARSTMCGEFTKTTVLKTYVKILREREIS